MKKVLSLAIAFTAALSLSACAMGNYRTNDRNRVGYDGGISTRRLSQQNNITNTTTGYRDGIYTGYGDNHANGNERAIVEIQNGRITNIHLDRVNQQGVIYNATRTRVTTPAKPGTMIDNQTGTDISARNETVTGNEEILRTSPGNTLTGIPSNIPRNTTGNIIGGTTGNTATNTPANIPRNTTGNIIGGTTGNTVTNTPANIPGNITGTRTNMNVPIGGTAVTTLDGARSNLANMMIRNQSYNVNIANTDTALTGTINNWKLAVRRALSHAGR